MIPYGRQLVDRSDTDFVVKSLQSDWLTQGPAIEKFELAVAKVTSAKFAVAVSNGTAALHAACFAAGIGPGDEVIAPTLSFAASANCILYCGGTPILCDIKLDTLTIDPEEVEKKITPKTKAVIAVDFAGHPAEWDKLRLFAKRYNLILIDDAAHALGSKFKGAPIGSSADLTTFSFHPVKAITTGEGGMIVTNNQKYAERMKLFRNHGIVKPISRQPSAIIHPAWYQEMIELGYNYRLTDIQAALGISQLQKLDRFLRRRRQIASKYIKEFSSIGEIVLPPRQDWSGHAWHIFPIQFKNLNRNVIYDRLLKSGIKCQIHYLPIHLQPYYQRKFGYKQGDFPKTEKYFNRCLTIPLYSAMTGQMVNKVIQEIKAAVKRGK